MIFRFIKQFVCSYLHFTQKFDQGQQDPVVIMWGKHDQNKRFIENNEKILTADSILPFDVKISSVFSILLHFNQSVSLYSCMIDLPHNEGCQRNVIHKICNYDLKAISLHKLSNLKNYQNNIQMTINNLFFCLNMFCVSLIKLRFK